VIIFGDHDESFAGQSAAYGLAHRLKSEGFDVEVRLPTFLGDWNDELIAMRGQP
jgi:putative DNA primase/helicase